MVASVVVGLSALGILITFLPPIFMLAMQPVFPNDYFEKEDFIALVNAVVCSITVLQFLWPRGKGETAVPNSA
jgi:hypothetical protein